MSDELILRDFSSRDLPGAGEIALRLWGSEADFIPASMLRELYEYLVRFYYVPDSPLSCAVTCNGELCAFMLAATEKHSSSLADEWLLKRISSPEEKKVFEIYKEYLTGNQKAEEKELRPHEAVLLLFASIRRGCGKLLMEELKRRCLKQDIRSILLWTDDTCNVQWYERNHFAEVSHFPACPSLPGQNLNTFLFRKELIP